MKKKIGEIYNIPIIIGDKNLKTKNEIHVDELSNVQSGGGSGSSEEKFGMVYLTKEALFQGLNTPMPDTMTQEEFKDIMCNLFISFAVVATRRDGNNCDPIQVFFENVLENRITFDRLDAVAVNFDQLMFDESYNGYIPIWKNFGASIEEARTYASQVFPNQLTEDEFFGRS
jgi:hypothetical protein